jgi:hypothetical protein
MCAVECSAFLTKAVAIKPLNASKPPAAIRQYASTISLSQRKVLDAAQQGVLR